MKLKLADNSLFAILLRSPWWVSFLVAGATTLAVAVLAPERFRWLGAFGALPIYGVGCVAAWRQW
ncbi:MAG: restriction endonuclease, partial [Giesbergeria sp.]